MYKIKQRLLLPLPLLLLLLLTLTLSGCVYQTISADEIALARWYCKDKEGVSEITEYFHSGTSITCKAPFSRPVMEASIMQDYLEYLQKETTKLDQYLKQVT